MGLQHRAWRFGPGVWYWLNHHAELGIKEGFIFFMIQKSSKEQHEEKQRMVATWVNSSGHIWM